MSFAQNITIQPYEASTDLGGRLIVAATTNKRVRLGAANTDKLVGVTERMGAQAGQMADVIQAGPTGVVAGGPIAFGDPITSDAQGRAVKATAVNGSLVYVIGFARADAVLGDVMPIHVAPGLIG